MAYRIAITYTQESGDKVDQRTISEDFSDDPFIHSIKQAVFTEELTSAMNRISQRLTTMAQEAMQGGKPGGKPQ